MTTQKLPLSAIVITAGTQIRAAIHEPTVEDYADAMRQGTEFPPVTVFHDGCQYFLADGFHRVLAASRLGEEQITANVKTGTKSDALKYALGANANHGLRRTNADKRRSVELALTEWPRLSDRAIADICAVGYMLVADVRKTLVPESGTCETTRETARVGKDGKQYPVKPTATEDAALGHVQSRSGVMPRQVESDSTRKSLQVGANGKPSPSSTKPEAKTSRVKAREGTLTPAKADEPTPESLPPLSELIHEVQYHLELVKADAEIILDRLTTNTVEPEDLEESVVELVFATKLVKTLARALAA